MTISLPFVSGIATGILVTFAVVMAFIFLAPVALAPIALYLNRRRQASWAAVLRRHPDDPEILAIELNEELFRGDLDQLSDQVIVELYREATETRLLFRKARNGTTPGSSDWQTVVRAWIRFLWIAVELKRAWLKKPDIEHYHRRQQSLLIELNQQKSIIQEFFVAEVKDEGWSRGGGS